MKISPYSNYAITKILFLNLTIQASIFFGTLTIAHVITLYVWIGTVDLDPILVIGDGRLTWLEVG